MIAVLVKRFAPGQSSVAEGSKCPVIGTVIAPRAPSTHQPRPDMTTGMLPPSQQEDTTPPPRRVAKSPSAAAMNGCASGSELKRLKPLARSSLGRDHHGSGTGVDVRQCGLRRLDQSPRRRPGASRRWQIEETSRVMRFGIVHALIGRRGGPNAPATVETSVAVSCVHLAGP